MKRLTFKSLNPKNIKYFLEEILPRSYLKQQENLLFHLAVEDLGIPQNLVFEKQDNIETAGVILLENFQFRVKIECDHDFFEIMTGNHVQAGSSVNKFLQKNLPCIKPTVPETDILNNISSLVRFDYTFLNFFPTADESMFSCFPVHCSNQEFKFPLEPELFAEFEAMFTSYRNNQAEFVYCFVRFMFRRLHYQMGNYAFQCPSCIPRTEEIV